jgi:AcrR family transcriptional regulator
VDRRKARTRDALIEAAVRLIADGQGERASIQQITETADVGFGSFYNHFESKEQLFSTASEQLLERWGELIDRACEGMTDPARIFAVSYRISCRLGWTHPEIARFLVGVGLDILDAKRGLAPRALRDIKAGQAAGRFTVGNAEVALSAASGGLLGLLRIRLARSQRIKLQAADDLTAAMLRMLGVSATEAAALAAEPLPDVEDVLPR